MIDEFLKYLEFEKNYASHTVVSYRTDLLQFVSYMQTDSIHFQPDNCSTENIQQWLMASMHKGLSARSVSRKLSALRKFWHFLILRAYTKTNPVRKILVPKTNKPLPTFFSKSEMSQALDDTFLIGDFEHYQQHVILFMFYSTGIRLSELIGIDDADIHFLNKTLKVKGKRNKQRYIPLVDEFLLMIKHFMHLRDAEVSRVGNHFFTLKSGKRLYPKYVYERVRSIMSEITNLSKNSPHVLRHTFATNILNEGADLNVVKELLGHSSLAATQVYTHTGFDELNHIYKHAHPRAN